MSKRVKVAACAVAVALPVIGLGIFAFKVQPVLARGENIASFFMGELTHSDNAPARSSPRVHRRAAAMSNRSVCVRLCDGYFFPLGNVSTPGSIAQQAAQCSSLCPAAPTRLFLVPPGADTIENATAQDGHLYSALPVAFRYTHVVDNTCTCQDGHQNELAKLMTDITLRPGDIVVTPGGLRVFTAGPGASASFTSVWQLQRSGIQAAALAAIENTLKLYRAAADEGTPGPPATAGAETPAVGAR